MKKTLTEPKESILVGVSDTVKRIDLGIKLPEHGKGELAALKKSIAENGVEVPILVRPDGPGGFEVVDGWHRLQVCRELGRAAPATLLKTISDARAREIAFEENLGRRPMTKEQKKEMAHYLSSLGFSTRTIAARLCVYHTTVARWLKAIDEPADEQIIEHIVISFFMDGCAKINKFKETVLEFLADVGSMETELREEAELRIKELHKEVLDLSNQLSGTLKALNERREPFLGDSK